MIRTRRHAFHPAVALILAFATAILVAACSGSSTSSFGVGPTTGPGDTMGLESTAPSGGY
jgi:hypothetical protein